MSPYRQTDYCEILAGVRAARNWFDEIGVPTDGTRLAELEAVLVDFTRDLEKRSPQEVVDRWDWSVDQRAYYALVDGAAFASVHRALSRLRSHELPRRAFRRALGGPLCPLDEDTSSTEARNIFLELDLGARVIESGLELDGWDDLVIRFQDTKYLVQCKRPYSHRGVASNIRAALEQIKRRRSSSRDRGLIALAVDKIQGLGQSPPTPVRGKGDVEGHVRVLANLFLEKHHGILTDISRPGLDGLILVYRFLTHSLPPLNTISAVLYEVFRSTVEKGTREHRRLNLLARQLASSRN